MHTFGKYTQLRFLNRFEIASRGNGLRQLFSERAVTTNRERDRRQAQGIKLVVEFQHMRNRSVEPLSQFLDFMTYSYMIDNINLLIMGTLHQRPISSTILWVASIRWKEFTDGSYTCRTLQCCSRRRVAR